MPAFWIDQATHAPWDHPGWPERFFDAAIGQVEFSDKRTLVSKASTLVDICMELRDQEPHQALLQRYLVKTEQEVPKSGALEYLDSFIGFEKTGDKGKARRLLRKAKKLASAANERVLLEHIEEGERFLSGAASEDGTFGVDVRPRNAADAKGYATDDGGG